MLAARHLRRLGDIHSIIVPDGRTNWCTRLNLGRIPVHRFVSVLILVGQTWHWYRERKIPLRAHLPLFRNFPSHQYWCWHYVGLPTIQTLNLDPCYPSPRCIDVRRARKTQDGQATRYSRDGMSREGLGHSRYIPCPQIHSAKLTIPSQPQISALSRSIRASMNGTRFRSSSRCPY